MYLLIQYPSPIVDCTLVAPLGQQHRSAAQLSLCRFLGTALCCTDTVVVCPINRVRLREAGQLIQATHCAMRALLALVSMLSQLNTDHITLSSVFHQLESYTQQLSIRRIT